MILFNIPPVLGGEMEYVTQAVAAKQLSGGKSFSMKCQTWFEEKLGAKRALATPSCTAALEMAALLIACAPGDEIIMPSYTFVSTANAFVLRGAKIVFVDVDPYTMNMCPKAAERAITENTKAIVVVHYAGVGCDMSQFCALSEKHDLFLIEDAAQCVDAFYQDKPLGSFGHLSTFSFHETKNITCGEGGMLVINDQALVKRAEILQEKGTNRKQFLNGEVDKYSWVDVGSSYLPSELQAAWLFYQLEKSQEITEERLKAWNYYNDHLTSLAKECDFVTQFIPEESRHNAHMYYIRLATHEMRDALMRFLKEEGVQAVFHYIPLHSSEAGMRFGSFHGEDQYTTDYSSRLLRLPMYWGLSREDQDIVIEKIGSFYQQSLNKEKSACV